MPMMSVCKLVIRTILHAPEMFLKLNVKMGLIAAYSSLSFTSPPILLCCICVTVIVSLSYIPFFFTFKEMLLRSSAFFVFIYTVRPNFELRRKIAVFVSIQIYFLNCK